MKEVVHTETLEQYEYVINKIDNSKHLNKYDYENYKQDNCINLLEGKLGHVDFYKRQGYKIISFNDFKSRYELKIGDTFEYNGFVCRVESEVKKWVYNTSAKAFYKTKTNHDHEIEITNKEFIKQLEENAR